MRSGRGFVRRWAWPSPARPPRPPRSGGEAGGVGGAYMGCGRGLRGRGLARLEGDGTLARGGRGLVWAWPLARTRSPEGLEPESPPRPCTGWARPSPATGPDPHPHPHPRAGLAVGEQRAQGPSVLGLPGAGARPGPCPLPFPGPGFLPTAPQGGAEPLGLLPGTRPPSRGGPARAEDPLTIPPHTHTRTHMHTCIRTRMHTRIHTRTGRHARTGATRGQRRLPATRTRLQVQAGAPRPASPAPTAWPGPRRRVGVGEPPPARPLMEECQGNASGWQARGLGPGLSLASEEA